MTTPFQQRKMLVKSRTYDNYVVDLEFTIPPTPPGYVMDSFLRMDAIHYLSRTRNNIAPLVFQRAPITWEDFPAFKGVFAHWGQIEHMEVTSGSYLYRQKDFGGYADCLTRLMFPQDEIDAYDGAFMVAMASTDKVGLGYEGGRTSFHPFRVGMRNWEGHLGVAGVAQHGVLQASHADTLIDGSTNSAYSKKTRLWHTRGNRIYFQGHPTEPVWRAEVSSCLPPPIGHPFPDKHYYSLQEPMHVKITLNMAPQTWQGAPNLDENDSLWFQENETTITCSFKSTSVVPPIPPIVRFFSPVLLNKVPWDIAANLALNAVHHVDISGQCVLKAACTIIMCLPCREQWDFVDGEHPFLAEPEQLSLFFGDRWIDINSYGILSMFNNAKHPKSVYKSSGPDSKRRFVAFHTSLFPNVTFPTNMSWKIKARQHPSVPAIPALNLQQEYAYVAALYHEEYIASQRIQRYVTNFNFKE